ncbi:hypothetical protein BSPWISOXPB_1109 [uncultured Gammaproteobacteria bacterium]|nr:hypothetical protein BSPWISOXPB_1109 [uncultured Gammaproteobacteria bacterium]
MTIIVKLHSDSNYFEVASNALFYSKIFILYVFIKFYLYTQNI